MLVKILSLNVRNNYVAIQVEEGVGIAPQTFAVMPWRLPSPMIPGNHNGCCHHAETENEDLTMG